MDERRALDVLRLLRGVSTRELAERLRRVLADERSAEAGRWTVDALPGLFGRGGVGAEMAVRAVAGGMDPAEVRLASELLVGGLVDALAGGR